MHLHTESSFFKQKCHDGPRFGLKVTEVLSLFLNFNLQRLAGQSFRLSRDDACVWFKVCLVKLCQRKTMPGKRPILSLLKLVRCSVTQVDQKVSRITVA